ncbi:hypothetical protein PBY51_003503 [Eleginops maclovinus]|uniref:Titin-like n=1 Tax=Eleginops maclovinus TaxID=56733 RepID=A0AAN7Y2H2_ELEMC|nr:hypothetical protein PBY51_003503 [Eleginops maclovinus]
MKFPVDLLAGVSQSEMERLANAYMNSLLFSDPDCADQLRVSDSSQVTIDVSSVGFAPLYGSSDKERVLALFSPSDPITAVALFLLDRWWTVDDLLKTADPDRDGAMKVETVGERIVLYILNRVVYRAKEMSSEELPFLCHGEKDHAKILWRNGEAVGFYSVKPQGTYSSPYSTRGYQLSVMDSIFVRKSQRGQGFGLQMLEDFVLNSKEDCLGLRYPLTKPMYKVCEKYLCQYPGDTHLLWEVESIGAPNQRTNISSKIQAMGQIAVSKSLTFTEESLVFTEVTEKDVVMEAISTQIKEAESMECTVEIVEEVTVLSATKVSEAEVPLTARGRSSGSKRRKMAEKNAEDKIDKRIRIEDIEAETPREEHVAESLQTEGVIIVAPEGQDVVGTEATILDQPEEDDVTSAPGSDEPQDGDDAPQDLNSRSCDSQIAVENVASGNEEDSAVLPVSEDIMEVPKEAETLHSVEQAELVEQQEVRLSTQAAADNGEAEETRGTVVKVNKTAQTKTPRRKSTRHNKQQEEAKKGPTAQDGRITLRGRTVVSTPKTTRKYTRRSQRVREEVEGVSTPEAVTEGEEQEEKISVKEDVVEVEELAEDKLEENEEEREKQQEEPAVEASSTEPTAETTPTQDHEDEKVTDDCEKQQKGEEMTQDKPNVSEDEAEEPPVVQKRALRGRNKVATKPSQDLPKQEEGEQKVEELAADQPMEEHQQVEEEEKADKSEGGISSEEQIVEEEAVPKAEEVAPSTEVNLEEGKEAQVEEETTEPEEQAVCDTGVAEDVTQEPDTAAAPETPDEVPSETGEPQEKDISSEIPKLQKATVILVDIKTACHHLSAREVDEAVDGETAAPEDQHKEVGGGKHENISDESAKTEEKHKIEEENSEKAKEKESAIVAEEEMVIETGEEKSAEEEMVIETGEEKSAEEGNQQEEEDTMGEDIGEQRAEKAEKDPAEEEQGEAESEAKEAVAAPVESADTDIPAGHHAEESIPPAEEREAMSLGEEEGPVVETRALRNKTKTSAATPTRKTRRGKEVDAENSEEEEDEEEEVTTRTLRHGRKAVSYTPKGKSKRSRKQVQEEEESVEETGIEEEEAEEEVEDKAPSEREECLEPKEGVEEAAAEKSTDGNKEEEAGLGSTEEPPTEEVKEKAPEEDKIELENKELGTLEVAKEAPEAAAEDHSVEPDLVADRAVLLAREEEATPSVEEQQSEETAPQLPDLKDTLENDAQEAKSAAEDGLLVQDTASEAEEESREEATAQENVPQPEVVKVEEEKQEAATARAADEKETEGVEEAENTNEQEATVMETRTRRSSRKQAVEATPRTRAARSRQKKGDGEKEAASEIQEEEPAIQVRDLRRGRKSIPDAQTTKTSHKQPQGEEKEEGGEEHKAVDVRRRGRGERGRGKAEDGEAQVVDQEQGEGGEKTEQEDGEAKHGPEEDVVAAEEEQAGEDTEALAGPQAAEGAVPTPETVGEDQPTSTPEGAKEENSPPDETEAEEAAAREEEPTEAGADMEKEAVAEESLTEQETGGEETAEDTPAAEKQDDKEEEEVAGGEIAEGPPVAIRVLRSGRKSAAARRSSKKARTQGQTEGEAPEEAEAEETEAGDTEVSTEEKTKEGEAAAQEEPAEAEKEKEEPVAEQETVGEECAPVEETAEDTPNAEEQDGEEEVAGGGIAEEEEEPVTKTSVLRKGRKSAAAALSRTFNRARKQKDEEASAPEDTEGEEEEAKQEAPEEVKEKGGSVETEKKKDVEEEEEAEQAKEEAALLEEDSVEAAEEETNTAEEEESTVIEGSAAAAEEEEDSVEEEKETPAAERALRSKVKTPPSASPKSKRQKDQELEDTPRRSVRKKPRVDYSENDEGGELGENNPERKDQTEPEEGRDKIHLVLDSEEEESEEEEKEPVETGKRVLRGRSVPSVVITSPYRSRPCSAKVERAEVHLTRSAQKRRNTEATPSRKSKRLSRI